MLEILYKMQPLDYVYLLVGIILFIFALTNKISYYEKRNWKMVDGYR